jgi:DNA-binding CsgD family transcriptional regulator
VAVLDLQLTAGYSITGDLEAMARHSNQAATLATQLGLHAVLSVAEHFRATLAALRGDAEGVRTASQAALAAAPQLRQTQGLVLLECEGLLALVQEDRATAHARMEAGAAILHESPSSSPSSARGLWPLLLSIEGADTAPAALADLEASGATVNRLNQGYVSYARAVLTGRSGEASAATALVAAGDTDLAHGPFWRQLGRRLLCDAALTDGWGEPRRWLEEAERWFAAHGFDTIAMACRDQTGIKSSRVSRPWADRTVTPREADVLTLVIEGYANKEIADLLFLSPRTVEKHLESLLRKFSARSRTQLALLASQTRSPEP